MNVGPEFMDHVERGVARQIKGDSSQNGIEALAFAGDVEVGDGL